LGVDNITMLYDELLKHVNDSFPSAFSKLESGSGILDIILVSQDSSNGHRDVLFSLFII